MQVYLGELNREAIKVELYSNDLIKQMQYQGEILNTQDGYIYSTEVPSTIPAAEFTARIIPSFADAAIPLEAPQILWQR